ncbi:LLLL and CFNLAS motif-containing protein 1 isoform X2 [Papio anubis]|uniref:LLLL and CFNLAS motif-containing protein 1 isoform X2 n=1 Tax=Papio anubis TaxID=9555 RepID=UPI0012AD2A1C|nr:LLLL and CFNLAS motif-containing protein 1 isoform X2 [Papio anubis]
MGAGQRKRPLQTRIKNSSKSTLWPPQWVTTPNEDAGVALCLRLPSLYLSVQHQSYQLPSVLTDCLSGFGVSPPRARDSRLTSFSPTPLLVLFRTVD